MRMDRENRQYAHAGGREGRAAVAHRPGVLDPPHQLAPSRPPVLSQTPGPLLANRHCSHGLANDVRFQVSYLLLSLTNVAELNIPSHFSPQVTLATPLKLFRLTVRVIIMNSAKIPHLRIRTMFRACSILPSLVKPYCMLSWRGVCLWARLPHVLG